jgi:hypothetical protein
VHVGAVADDFRPRDGIRLDLPGIKATALANSDLIDDLRARHRAPAKRQIDRGQPGLDVAAIIAPPEDKSFELKIRDRAELVVVYPDDRPILQILL